MQITRRCATGFMAGILPMLLSACGRWKQGYRYRLTIEIETPQGIVKGSAVQEMVHGSKIWLLPGGDSFNIDGYGEAVVVDLPHGTLFVLLRPCPETVLEMALRYGVVKPSIDVASVEHWPTTRPQLFRALSYYRATVTVPYSAISDFVDPWDVKVFNLSFATFDNRNDPKSIRILDPQKLDREFGPGIRLSRIIFQSTDEPLTTTIEARLPWLRNFSPRWETDDNPRDALPSGILGLRRLP